MRRVRGRCIQVIVHGGLSDMQVAEADMARSEGVPVVKLYLDQEIQPAFVLASKMGDAMCALAASMMKVPATKARDEAPSGRELPAGYEWETKEVRRALDKR